MLLVTVLALLVTLAWVIGYALFLRNPPEPGDPTVALTPTTSASSRSSTPNRQSLTPNPRPLTPNPPSPTSAPFSGFAVVTSTVLNLRAAPTIEAPVLGTLKFGDIVQIVRRDGAWYETTQGSWISSLYVEVRQTRPEAESYARELTR